LPAGSEDRNPDQFLLAMLLLGLLVGVVGVASRIMPATIGLVGIGLCSGGAWMLLSRWRPLTAFRVMLFVFVTLYARSSIGFGGGAGAGGGTLALGDLIWLGTLVGMAVRPGRATDGVRFRGLTRTLWGMVPFVALSALLPLVGVLGGGWPASYAVVGFRQFQWVSLVPMVFVLCRDYGVEKTVRAVVVTLVLSGVVHAAYGLAQFGHGCGLLSSVWVLPDRWYSAMSGKYLFFYARTTGLLTNPNSWGVYAAVLLGVVLAFRPQGFTLVSFRMHTAVIIVVLLGLSMSGSRSALLGCFALLLSLLIMSSAAPRLAIGGAPAYLLVGLLVVAMLPLLRDVLPVDIVQRFGRLAGIFSEGSHTDATAAARVHEWKRLWASYVTQYPLGTLVPSGYALKSAVDSFYVATAIQGTPLFTVTWLIFLLSAAQAGFQVYLGSALYAARGVGLLLVFTSAVFAGAGLGMTPMLEPQLVSVFWVLVGVVVYATAERTAPRLPGVSA
jgi:hypothetical protein